jgi:hypothetical protein
MVGWVAVSAPVPVSSGTRRRRRPVVGAGSPYRASSSATLNWARSSGSLLRLMISHRAPRAAVRPVRRGGRRPGCAVRSIPSNQSSLRGITPSRGAHGHRSSSSTSRACIAACATKAPATSWWDLLAQAGVGERTAGPQPRRRGGGTGEPSQRPERLRGTHYPVRGPTVFSFRAGPSSCSMICARRFVSSRRRGGSCASQDRVSRPAASGSATATSGSSSIPLVTSSDPPPISSMSSRPAAPPADREEGEDGLPLTGTAPRAPPGLVPHPGEHRTGVGGITHRSTSARPAAAPTSPSSWASGAHPGAHSPPAGEWCWNRHQAHRAARQVRLPAPEVRHRICNRARGQSPGAGATRDPARSWSVTA